MSVAREMTNRRRAKQALRGREAARPTTHEEIRHLGGRLIAAQEEERRRIARELHDDLSQKLALLTIELDELSQTSSMEPGAKERLRRVTDQAGQIATDVHRLSYQLHPSKLETLGLVASIRDFCRHITNRRGIYIDFTHTGLPPVIPHAVSLCIFRIVQEALYNVIRHSSARNASVKLCGTDDGLRLQVVDSGVGFAPDRQEGQGLGLVSMRERAHLLRGNLVIHSARGHGTRVQVHVPLDSIPHSARAGC